MTTQQRCVICAWRQTCAKKFSVTDGGARCPDFTRDVTIRESDDSREHGEKDREKK